MTAAACFLAVGCARKDDGYMGAQQVLRVYKQNEPKEELTVRSAAEKFLTPAPAPTPAIASGPADPLTTKIDEYIKALPGDNAQQAADQWLDLVDSYPASANYYGGFSRVIAALPPPADWPALRLTIQRRNKAKSHLSQPDWLLELVANALMGDETGQWADMLGIEAALNSRTLSALKKGKGDTAKVARLREELDLRTPTADHVKDFVLSRVHRSVAASVIALPNLLDAMSRKDAEKLLRAVIPNCRGSLYVEEGPLLGLAQKVALESVNSMQTPQWLLSCSPDGRKLFEALRNRFGLRQIDVSQSSSIGIRAPLDAALWHYLADLIEAGEFDHATGLAASWNLGRYSMDIPLRIRHGAIYNPNYHRFANALIARVKSKPAARESWNWYRMGTTLGSDANREQLLRLLATAQPGNKDVDDAVTEVIRSKSDLTRLLARFRAVQDNNYPRAYSLWLYLRATHDPSLGEYAVNKLPFGQFGISDMNGQLERLVYVLHDIGLGPKTEKACVDHIVSALKPYQALSGSTSSPYGISMGGGFGGGEVSQEFAALLVVYSLADRPDDVLKILQDVDDWGSAGDVTDLIRPDFEMSMDADLPPLTYHVAKAVAAKGNDELAFQLLSDALNRDPLVDCSYELLLKLKGAQAGPILDQIQARDPTNDRPAIWKAELLLQQGDVSTAERLIRAAIAVNPANMRQPPDGRAKPYEVLLAVLKTKAGSNDEIGRVEQRIHEIRTAEAAEDAYDAGLYVLAANRSKDAIAEDAHDYWPHMVLGLSLEALGQYQLARSEYEIAFELMPDQIGAIDSMPDELDYPENSANAVGEVVLRRRIALDPKCVGAHLILGEILSQSNRYAQAKQELERAERMNPSCKAAWTALNNLPYCVVLSSSERRAIIANAMAPQYDASMWESENSQDYPLLWKCTVAAEQPPLPVPSPLFKLRQSKHSTRFFFHMSILSENVASGRQRFARERLLSLIASTFDHQNRISGGWTDDE